MTDQGSCRVVPSRIHAAGTAMKEHDLLRIVRNMLASVVDLMDSNVETGISAVLRNPEPRELRSERCIRGLKVRETLQDCCSDVSFQRKNWFPRELQKPFRGAQEQRGVRRGSTQHNTNLVKRLLPLEGLDCLRRGRGDLDAADAYFDEASRKHGGCNVARGVLEPSVGRLSKVVQQLLPLDKPPAVQVVAQIPEGEMVGIDRAFPPHPIDQPERVVSRGNRRKVRRPQEAFRRRRLGLDRGILEFAEHLFPGECELLTNGGVQVC